MVGGKSGWTVAYLLETSAILLLPLSILTSIARHQLWEIDLRPQRRTLLAVASGVVAIAALSGFAFYRLDESRQARIQAQTAALLNQAPGPLIVDTDMGNDDVLALLFLMQHPGVELHAVTVVGTGLVHCAPGVRNVQGLLELTQYANIPVSCGTEEPLNADHPFPQAWRSAADRLWGLNLPANDRQPSPLPAPDLLVESLAEADQPITVLALGPLTNLAQAFQSAPEVIEKIERLYLMGGAVEAPGNVYDPNLGFDNQTAEWNIYADPLAARFVFETGVPITMVPLDATNYVPVSMPFFQRLQQHHPTRAGTFTFNIFYINQGWIQSGGYYLWDTLAAAVLK
jgi:inosine-uridine nucleoside N-ribohydrolase